MNDTFYDFLPNGIQIVHRLTPSPVAYLGILVGAGTRHEQPNENGMAHYIEHCVFKGCRPSPAKPDHTLSSHQIIRRIEDIGGEINAYTTKEETVFYAATPIPYIKRTLQLLAALVFQPTFPKAETDKEVKVIVDEIESYNDSPSELIYDDFEGLIFQNHPLALPILGTRKTLRRISQSPKHALQWMAQHYLPERTVIFSQANIPFAKMQAYIRQTIDDFQSVLPRNTYSPPEKTALPLHHQAIYRRHTHQTHCMLGARAFPLGDPEQLTAYLINHILGGGSMSARLNLALREKKGLVYTIESQYTPLSDTGYWNIYFACEPQHTEQCIDLCKRELRRLCEKPLSSAQFDTVLRQLHGQMAISAENQENNFLTMGKQMLYFHQAPRWQETFEHIRNITPEQVQQTANRIFREEDLCLLQYQ